MSSDSNAPVKCLLVDDHGAADSSLLSALLSRGDVELLRASSVAEALELLLVNDVALALIALETPGMAGLQLAEGMRASTNPMRSVPIIFITAGLREGDSLFEGEDAGPVDFLFQPIDERILRHKLASFLQLHGQRRELNEARAERERLLVKLADTVRFNETFVGAVAHDLRNPLNAILMAAELSVRRIQDPALLKLARRIQASGRRIASMIDDLSDLAKARLSGGISVRPHAFDLLGLARRVISQYQSTHPDREMQLQSSGDLAGQWDEARVEQVISSLLGNALQHGEETRAVSLSLDGSAAEQVVLTVHNWGRIEPEALPYIFEPFRAGRKDRTRSEGLGLGLFIVRHILLAHGGSVTVTSTDAAGTTFRVQLPRTAEPAPS